MIRSADARQAGSENQDIDVIGRSHGMHLQRRAGKRRRLSEL
jgi:hypothetical protein